MSGDLTRFVYELCDSVSLRDLIGQKVKLTKRGREYIGLCPFHNEKTPSFHVVEHKNFYHCFGCGQHGRAIEWVMHQHYCDFKEAVIILCDIAGVTPPIFEQKKHYSTGYSQGDNVQDLENIEQVYFDVLECATRFFSQQYQSDNAKHVRDYCQKRGLDDAIIQEFRIGYASGQGLLEYLQKYVPACSDDILSLLGLVKKNESQYYYEFFRNRLIFPIQNKYGRVIAFGGRYMGDAKNDNTGKYINSPEHPLFDKGATLYNAHRAFGKKNQQSIVVVEGYMDVVTLSQYGIEGALAPLGTAISERQIRTIWRYDASPILGFDGDQAGKKAGYRACERILPLLNTEKNYRLIFLPDEHDPDSYIRQYGKKNFQKYLHHAHDIFEFLWLYESVSLQANQPQSIGAVEKALHHHCTLMSDAILAKNYRYYFHNQLWEWRKKHHHYTRKSQQNTMILPDVQFFSLLRYQAIIAILLHFPVLLNEYFDEIMAIKFPKNLDKYLTKLHMILTSGNKADIVQQASPKDEKLDDDDHLLNGNITTNMQAKEFLKEHSDIPLYYKQINDYSSQDDMALLLRSLLNLVQGKAVSKLRPHNSTFSKDSASQQHYLENMASDKQFKQQFLSEILDKNFDKN